MNVKFFDEYMTVTRMPTGEVVLNGQRVEDACSPLMRMAFHGSGFSHLSLFVERMASHYYVKQQYDNRKRMLVPTEWQLVRMGCQLVMRHYTGVDVVLSNPCSIDGGYHSVRYYRPSRREHLQLVLEDGVLDTIQPLLSHADDVLSVVGRHWTFDAYVTLWAMYLHTPWTTYYANMLSIVLREHPAVTSDDVAHAIKAVNRMVLEYCDDEYHE